MANGKRGAPMGNRNAAGGGILGSRKKGIAGLAGLHSLNPKGKAFSRNLPKNPFKLVPLGKKK